MPIRWIALVSILLLLSGCSSCSDEADSTEKDGATDGDSDTDSDSDTDGDSDTDSDTDTSPVIEEKCENGWCEIPAGSYVFGSPPSEPCRDEYSDKQFPVTITRPFVIQQTEVTQAQWEAAGFPNPSRDLAVDKPVVFVNYFEAMAYANALSVAEGLDTCYDLSGCLGEIGSGCPEEFETGCLISAGGDFPEDILPQIFRCEGDVHRYADWYACPGYRLPTSAEWEYAARAGSTTSTFAGDLITDDMMTCADPSLDPVLWCFGNTTALQPVGQKLKNGWGLYDVLGNTGEWTDYVFKGLSLQETLGQSPPFFDPQGDGVGIDRDLRGGFYLDEACFCRLGSQRGMWAEVRGIGAGIRLVRTQLGDDAPDAGDGGK